MYGDIIHLPTEIHQTTRICPSMFFVNDGLLLSQSFRNLFFHDIIFTNIAINGQKYLPRFICIHISTNHVEYLFYRLS